MKNILLKLTIAIFVTLSFTKCKQDTFDYQMYEPSIDDVDSVYFSPGDVMLIADGKASLKFIVEAFKRFERQNGEVTREFMDFRELPEGSLKIVEEVTGQEIDELTFSIDHRPEDTLRFYAQVGSVKSAVRKVALRPAPTLPEKVYVDVIFHTWELNPSNSNFDITSYQPTSYSDIVEGLAIMNDVVNNRIGTAANGASVNVEFRLAKFNPQGQELEQPGYNLIVYGDEVKTNPMAATVSLADFRTYISNNPSQYIWDAKKYLNIHVLPSGSNYTLSNLYPPKQLAPKDGEELIPGVPEIALDVDDYVNDFVNVCIFMPHTLFKPGYERRIEIFGPVGAFYGLYPTTSYSTARYHSDYCGDTQEYNPQDPRNDFFFATKVNIQGDKFVIENAMDDTRYPSMRNSITLDQVERMRAVLARCPGRMNSQAN